MSPAQDDKPGLKTRSSLRVSSGFSSGGIGDPPCSLGGWLGAVPHGEQHETGEDGGGNHGV